MAYDAGLDVSLRSTHLCIIDDEGKLLAEGKTDSEVEDIITFLITELATWPTTIPSASA